MTFALALLLVSLVAIIVAACVFRAIWSSLGTSRPFLAGLVCCVIGCTPLTWFISEDWFGLGELALHGPLIAMSAGLALVGFIYFLVGSIIGLRNAVPALKRIMKIVIDDSLN